MPRPALPPWSVPFAACLTATALVAGWGQVSALAGATPAAKPETPVAKPDPKPAVPEPKSESPAPKSEPKSSAAPPTATEPPAAPNNPPDARWTEVRNLNHKHNLVPPRDPAVWADRRDEIRRRVLIASGLYPLPEKTPLKAAVYGRQDRGDYTVERVTFQSLPGYHVTGNLYRPKGFTGKRPAVLNPHGHWNNGRFYMNSDKGVADELRTGRESDPVAARSPLQARCANLAMLGCVAFHYDMVGYADNFQIPHRFAGNKPNELSGPDAAAFGVGVFGLQTWNSIRALDFLLELPDVDPAKIAVTGSSGGGTQTFILAAVDDRVAVSAPVVMVSTGMQGGCQCENGPHLRVGTDNIELAAVYAPKPQIVIGATGDWTKEIMEAGAPELRATYALLGKPDHIEVVRHESPHNYNRLSRESMYRFLGRHLLGMSAEDAARIKERPFRLMSIEEMSVWDAEHPKPADALKPDGLRDAMITRARAAAETLVPRTAADLAAFRRDVAGGLAIILDTRYPPPGDVEAKAMPVDGKQAGRPMRLSRRGTGESVPAVWHPPAEGKGTGRAWLVVSGDGAATAALPGTLADAPAKGEGVLAVDAFLTGRFAAGCKEPTGEFFAGYNRTVTGNRVHDILTAAAWLRGQPGVREVHVVARGEAGVWAVLAAGLAGGAVASVTADGAGFATGLKGVPCGELLGGMRVLAATAAPTKLTLRGLPADFRTDVLMTVYKLAGAADRLEIK